MPLTRKRREELALMMLPTDNEMQGRVRGFLLESGMSQTELAEAIGYSDVAISHFLKGRYGANCPDAVGVAANLKAACKAFMDQFESKKDIRLRGEHYPTVDFERVQTAAFNALREGLAYVVDGPPGTQKSWSLLNVQKQINESGMGRAIYVYSRVDHTKQTLLQEVCRAAGIPNGGSVDRLLNKLQFFLAKEPILLLIDEGNHLSISALEVLRQLLDLPPYFGVIIAGSHDLSKRLRNWQMEQWRRRVQGTIQLEGPQRGEARKILAKQLGLTDFDEADAIIADCMATAQKWDPTTERNRRFDYISAGLLFGVIRGAKATPELQEVAA